MSKVLHYLKNNETNFDFVIQQLIEVKKLKQFTIKETSYTKTILTNNNTFIFNDTGKADTDMLRLINLVKNDANKYLKTHTTQNYIKEKNKKFVTFDFYYFNDINFNNNYFEGYQLDLNSAYWHIAEQYGIITKKTVDIWESITKKYNKKAKKLMRLKALGTLATKKLVTEYNNGKFELKNIEQNFKTTNLYMFICHTTANIMKRLVNRYKLPYYYWDMCIVQNSEQLKSIEIELKNEGIGYKLETDTFEIVKGTKLSYIYSHLKNYNYPINKKHILL